MKHVRKCTYFFEDFVGKCDLIRTTFQQVWVQKFRRLKIMSEIYGIYNHRRYSEPVITYSGFGHLLHFVVHSWQQTFNLIGEVNWDTYIYINTVQLNRTLPTNKLVFCFDKTSLLQILPHQPHLRITYLHNDSIMYAMQHLVDFMKLT